MSLRKFIFSQFVILLVVISASACSKKSFDVRDVEPDKAGTVRSLGPESQDVIRVADLMTRSLLETPAIRDAETPPTIALLPMENNSRFPINKEVFTTRLKAQLNEQSNGAMRFISRDIMDDIQAEREAKRAGEIDYDPARRTMTVAGADFFLKGRLDGLSTASRKGQSEYSLYSFKLVDAETGIELWEKPYEVKREGKDDVVYR